MGSIDTAHEFLAELLPEEDISGDTIGIGVVTNKVPLYIAWEGDIDDAGNSYYTPQAYARVDSYSPVVGDRVLMLHTGNTWTCLGSLAMKPDWQPLSYGTNVADFDPVGFDAGQYCKFGGVVYLRGQIKATGTIAINATLATLPTNYGLSTTSTSGSMFSINYARAGAVNAMRVQIKNYLLMLGFPGLVLNDNFSLSGISFPADI
jgi:hypothetical protein